MPYYINAVMQTSIADNYTAYTNSMFASMNINHLICIYECYLL